MPFAHQSTDRILTESGALETARQSSFILDPDHDYYHHSSALIGCNILIILFELGVGGAVLGVTISRDTIARFLAENVTMSKFIPRFIGTAFGVLCVNVLLSFLIDWTVTRNGLRRYFRKSTLLVILYFVNVSILATAYLFAVYLLA